MLKENNLLKFFAKKINLFVTSGVLAVFISILIFSYTFFPVIQSEIRYLFHKSPKNMIVEIKNNQNIGKENVMFPVDEDFGIVIPKIEANSRVIEEVDPYNDRDYQWALTKGLAHAKGTSLPGREGNIFIFSHSAVNFYEANRYNAVFYLLSKLERGDEIYLFYEGVEYKYTVTSKATVDPGDLFYLTQKTSKKMLTLMTCWPPGTTLQRLIVVAEM